MKRKNAAALCALLAAALYAVNIPLSKLFLRKVAPTMMAAFLYLGAGVGLCFCRAAGKVFGREAAQEPLTRAELPYTAAMVVLDIAAPILLMLGIQRTSSANVSLLSSFEIAATSLIAFFAFHERVSQRLCAAIVLVTAASILLGFEGADSFRFNTGSLLVLGACVCWGLENNCTRMLSSKSSVQIVTIKGCFSGLGSLVIAWIAGERIPGIGQILMVMALGFVAYGLSINFYIKAQKELGAAKTSAFYSIAPFLGVGFSVLLLREQPGLRFYAALAIMLIATILMAGDTISLQHSHEHTHTHSHAHSHGNTVHTHEHTHVHTHVHIHGENETAHNHEHNDLYEHTHIHEAMGQEGRV